MVAVALELWARKPRVADFVVASIARPLNARPTTSIALRACLLRARNTGFIGNVFQALQMLQKLIQPGLERKELFRSHGNLLA